MTLEEIGLMSSCCGIGGREIGTDDHGILECPSEKTDVLLGEYAN